MFGVMLWILFLTLCVLGALTLLILAAYSVFLVHVHWKYAHLPGPPLNNFYLGNLPELRKMEKKNKIAQYLFLEWAEQYGPLYRIFVLHKCLIIPSSRTMIKEFLTKSKYPKTKLVYNKVQTLLGERFLGSGLVSNIHHDSWKRRRTALNPAFHKKYLQTLMGQFNNVGDLWTEQLQTVADGTTSIQMLEYMSRVTLDVIGRVGFNMELDSIRNKDNAFPEALATILKGMNADLKDPLLKLKWSQRSLVRSVRSCVQFIRQQAVKVMEERQTALNSGQCVPNDILGHLLTSLDCNPELTMDDLADDFATLLIAGQETTANMLSFLLSEVGRKPEIYQRLQEEVDEVVGDKTTVTFDDLGRLNYMSDVISETLRLCPPAPGTARETPTDVCIEGFYLPKSTPIIISYFVMHRLDKYFPDPMDFNPDRWATSENRLFFTYMPFSLGQRGCLGKHFALIESKVLLCKFFQKFSYTLDPDQSFAMQQTATLRPKAGVVMTVNHR